jgi:broad specificity phosphatase PhoE
VRSALEEKIEELQSRQVPSLYDSQGLKVIIIASHNNAILGYIQFYRSVPLPKTVLPNGAVVKIVVRDGVATFSLLTKDGDNAKFLKREHILDAFPSPVPFAAPNCIIYLVRHGESEANVGTKYEDPSLTAVGRGEAVRAGEAIVSDLDGPSVFILVSSPLPRAVQTIDHIKTVLRTVQQIVFDVSCIESARDMGRPIHTRGPNAIDETIIACDPRRPLDDYRKIHICNPDIDKAELEKLVAPNRLPSAYTVSGASSELLMKQLEDKDWPRVAALTPLHELVALHL